MMSWTPRLANLTAFVLFCDDIRREVGAKRTFVGVYTSALFVPAFPRLIPKFYAFTTVLCAPKQFPTELKVSLMFRDEEVGLVERPTEELAKQATAAEQGWARYEKEFPPDDPPKSRITVEMCISPFVVPREGRLSSHVHTNMGSFRAGSIFIRQKEGADAGWAIEDANDHQSSSGAQL